MTVSLRGWEVSKKITEKFPDAVAEVSDSTIIVKSGLLFEVAQFLKTAPGFEFDYLTDMTSVDYYDYFEVVYRLTSIKNNHTLVLKTRCYDRENPALPSVVSLWQGADYQEREIYDLMGIRFNGHPNLKRIVLWEGFQGHPLRKDYLTW